ncbi:VOC family protein [Planococcus sp. CP5-4]|uniref:VOC family protein n=1 Tax=unclassified Planococcus (in: firmicutes) TaxID=2662419 RepID=UPI001C23154A|nr:MULTISPECIES: VOC family protein [unclassified Planococcus (in: firmicutes)]MBU9673312.1 VOC family protein [Planococcus sp. CP5-4_YE]MBV0908085.1 VOC family protein [Planococcus sp. CP5-4_UN]MBW6062146.1 VOC family protein [Planococcus sp. CP5-4]
MISKIGQVMVYVRDQDAAVTFWTEKMGFTVMQDVENEGMRWVEIVPREDAETSIVLQDKNLLEQMDTGLSLETPSLLFYVNNFEQLRNELTEKDVTVGDIVAMPTGRTFNFADAEDNYFAVLELN